MTAILRGGINFVELELGHAVNLSGVPAIINPRGVPNDARYLYRDNIARKRKLSKSRAGIKVLDVVCSVKLYLSFPASEMNVEILYYAMATR